MGWINSILFNVWRNKIFLKYINKNYIDLNNLLLVDSAPSHLKDILDIENIIFIPKGATYLLQQIDVSIGKPYKDKLRKKFEEYFNENHNNLTKSGIIKKPPKEIILKMHSDAIKSLDPLDI